MRDVIEAGPELDALIDEHVFGRRRFTQDEMRAEAEAVWKEQPLCRVFLKGFAAIEHPVIGGPFVFRQVCPHYSADIAAAWRVVDKMREHGYWFGFDNVDDVASAWFEQRELAYGNAATAPHAICLAALAAIPVSAPSLTRNES